MGIQISGGGPEHIYESATADGEIEATLGPREEVVRCRDCKNSKGGGWKCTRFWEAITANDVGMRGHITVMYANVRPNSFCSWGERR